MQYSNYTQGRKIVKKITKKKREKKYRFRNFKKEIKRVKWPTSKEASRSFWTVILFIVICTLLFMIVTIIATYVWNNSGVGINV